MGLGNFLRRLEKSAERSRLAYHGYTPEVIEQQRAFLAEREAERQARIAHAERQAEIADAREERAAAAAEQAAAEDQRRRQEARVDSLSKQLAAGVMPDNLMGREDVPGEVLADIIEGQLQQARARRETEAAKAATKKQADTDDAISDDARALARHRRQKEIDREFKDPPPDDDSTDKPDPFEVAARPIVMAEVSSNPDKTYTRQEISAMIVEEAAAARARRKGKTPIVDPAASALARAKAAAPGARKPPAMVKFRGQVVPFASLPPEAQALVMSRLP